MSQPEYSSAPSNYSPSQTSKPAKEKRSISIGQILAGILLVLVVVFIVENSRSVRVRLIGPEVTAPLYIPILIAAVLGALIAGLMRARRQHKKKKS